VIRAISCAECRELLGGYVLEALERDEFEAVRSHLETCDRCAAEHGELAPLPAMLDLAGSADATPERPPATLEDAVLDRFARESATAPARRRWRPRRPALVRKSLRLLRSRPLATILAGAALGAAAAVGIVAATSGVGGGAQQSRITASGPVSESYTAQLAAQPAAPHASATAALTTFASGTRIHMYVHGLPARAVYELWCLRDDGARVSAGTFRVDAGGNADIRLTTAATPDQYHRLAVERRPWGTDSPARGKRVLAGEITS
jgi:anti-sigma factor RsiW